ncbi:MAG: glycosyltransferase [Gemmatimonadales bacterium]|nr:MAG: glycosyltransferase [Gemmatimonadales bacterium]
MATGGGDPWRDVAVVVPCFNEARRLDMEAFTGYAGTHAGTGFLFVDDGSSDGTADLITRASQEVPGLLRLHRMPENVGKAEAVRAGMLRAMASGARIVGFLDADLATPVDELEPMVGLLRANPELEGVLGSRVRLLGHRIQRDPHRHYLGRVFATLASLILDLPVYDTQCGAKLFRATDALRTALEAPFRSRWIFDVELLSRLRAARGDRLSEILEEYPLRTWRDVAGSKLRIRDMGRALVELDRIRRAPALPGQAVS